MPQRPHTFRNANVPKPLKLSKGKLVRVDWGEHAEEVKRIWEQKPRWGLTPKSKMNKIIRLIGYGSNLVGFCSQCRELNTHILQQKCDGAIIITRFCEQHLP